MSVILENQNLSLALSGLDYLDISKYNVNGCRSGIKYFFQGEKKNATTRLTSLAHYINS